MKALEGNKMILLLFLNLGRLCLFGNRDVLREGGRGKEGCFTPVQAYRRAGQ